VAELTFEDKRRNKIAVYYRDLMQQREMSGNQLAQASGVSEATIRKLLEPDVDPDEIGFHPLVLRATSEALGVDTIYVFQLAGYLEPKEPSSDLSDEEFYFAVRFRQLPSDKRRLLWEMLQSLERASDISTPGEHIAALIREVNHLRRQHPMFVKRRFSVKDEIGRVLGNVTHTTTPHLMLDRFILVRLGYILGDAAPDRQRVEQVVSHPDAVIILNTLLPRKEIPTSLEKFFWLTNPSGTLDQPINALDPAVLEGIKALWLLLDKVAQSESTKTHRTKTGV
jgi:hypothetical protein